MILQNLAGGGRGGGVVWGHLPQVQCLANVRSVSVWKIDDGLPIVVWCDG